MAYFKSLINWYIPMAVFKKRRKKRSFVNLVVDWMCFSLASSVSKEYGVALSSMVLEQRLVWLERPIREW